MSYYLVMEDRKRGDEIEESLSRLLAYMWPERWRQLFLPEELQNEAEPDADGFSPVTDLDELASYYGINLDNLEQPHMMTGAQLVEPEPSGPRILRQV